MKIRNNRKDNNEMFKNNIGIGESEIGNNSVTSGFTSENIIRRRVSEQYNAGRESNHASTGGENQTSSTRLAAEITKAVIDKFKYFKYSGETEAELEHSFIKSLALLGDRKSNRLIAMKLLDLLVGSLFPELLEV